MGSSRFPPCCSIETSSIKRTPSLVIFTVCRPIISEGAVKVDCNQYPPSVESSSLSFSPFTLVYLLATYKYSRDNFLSPTQRCLSEISSHSLICIFFPLFNIAKRHFLAAKPSRRDRYAFSLRDDRLVYNEKKYCLREKKMSPEWEGGGDAWIVL